MLMFLTRNIVSLCKYYVWFRPMHILGLNLKEKSWRELSRTVNNFSFISSFSFATENV